MLYLTLMLGLGFGLYQKIEVKAQKLRHELRIMSEKMQEEARVLKLMNSRILVLERRILTLLGILPSPAEINREQEIMEVTQELEGLSSETGPLVADYIKNLKAGLALMFVQNQRISKIGQWRNDQEKVQKKLMDAYGFTTAKSDPKKANIQGSKR